MQDVDYFSH